LDILFLVLFCQFTVVQVWPGFASRPGLGLKFV